MQGQLIGVHPRDIWYQPDPYGMLYLPMGSYNMGPSDQDVPYAHTTKAKTVSVQAFYIDQHEISNNEYRQFVYWVRDSIVHRILGEEYDEHFITENIYGEEIDPPQINWHARIEYNDPEIREILEDEIYLPDHERFYNRREVDTRKLNFEYYWIDLRDAARKGPQGAPLRERGLTDRSVFIKRDVINVYPDTLCWVHDFTYSFNEPMTNMYFWHPAYDDYPVVGVTWKQARAFCIWRTQLLNSYLQSIGSAFVQDFRLPTESEWEYAARGGLDLSPYPWGGPYTRNTRGCFMANFKPLRGNYVDDGGFHTVRIDSYHPNEWGLYNMAGNVAEWTSNAFDESAYDFAHDLNMDYVYEAKEDDPPVLKRKVIRGGSWKDIGYYIQTGTKTYEYQDTAKSYIGFRCVMTYLGRAKGDDI
ncbi:MAG: gliding motility-associated lipoprotein [Bacteroidetes bacterium]|nr:MAG: gliding motility-associated lipoprotein [Bacteroidota bacterium]